MTVPLTGKWITLSRSRTEWKASPGTSICHQWFNLNFMRILFVCKENKNNQQIVSSLSLLSSNRHFGYYPPKGPPSQRDSHKPPGFYLKYLKLSSEDELSFYGVWTTCGLVNNDNIFILGWSNPLSVLEGNTDSYTLKYTLKKKKKPN